MIQTVLGEISEENLGVILPHEHVSCYFEYFYKMAGKDYLDKERLCNYAVKHLTELKEKYKLSSILDCTPVNIGRDIDLIKAVSEKSGVNILCSTGFYYTEEAMLYNISEDAIYDNIMKDIKNINAGNIKFAIEAPEMSALLQKLLSVLCEVQKKTHLPLCIHTNGKNQNGFEVINFALKHDVLPEAVTLGHLSDAADLHYVERLAQYGCYLGFDRIYTSSRDEYYQKKAMDIYTLCEKGFSDKILLSHDGLTFNGFMSGAVIREDNPYAIIFEKLIPQMKKIGMTEQDISELMESNPKKMLLCKSC